MALEMAAAMGSEGLKKLSGASSNLVNAAGSCAREARADDAAAVAPRDLFGIRNLDGRESLRKGL
jgi:hypothetical protein